MIWPLTELAQNVVNLAPPWFGLAMTGLVAIAWLILSAILAVCTNTDGKILSIQRVRLPTSETLKTGVGIPKKNGRFTILKNSGKRISSRNRR